MRDDDRLVVEIADKRAIPYGWARAFIPTIFVISLFFLLRHFGILDKLGAIGKWSILFATVVMSIILKGSWWEEYWERNIRGWNLWYIYQSAVGVSCINTKILERGQNNDTSLQRISIPLGGWFNRHQLYGHPGVDEMLAASAAENLDTIHHIWLKDKYGNRIKMAVDTALHFLATSRSAYGNITDSISEGFLEKTATLERCTLKYEEERRWLIEKDAKLIELQKKFDIAADLFWEAILLIKKTGDRLTGTKRAIRSKEVAAINQWLHEQNEQCLMAGAPPWLHAYNMRPTRPIGTVAGKTSIPAS